MNFRIKKIFFYAYQIVEIFSIRAKIGLADISKDVRVDDIFT